MRFMHGYTRQTYETLYGAGFWTRKTLLDTIAEHARTQPTREAIIDSGTRLGYAQLVEAIDGLACSLRARGVAAGDLVAAQLPNSAHLAVLILALLRLGAVYLPINPAYRKHDVSRIFKVALPRLHVYPRRFKDIDYAQISREACEAMEQPPASFEIDIDAPLSDILEPSAPGVAWPNDPDAPFLFGTTSGSTGAPKLYAHVQNTQLNEARVLNELYAVSSRDTFLVCFPLTHRGALMFGLLQAMQAGGGLVILREYNAEAIVRSIEKERVSAFFSIPTQVYELLEVAQRLRADCASMRLLMLAGAPVHPELTALIQARWKGCFPITGYGASEGGFSTCTRLDDPPEKLLTCGRAIPGQEVRIDPDQRNGNGEGEVQVRGAFLFGGYYADQHQTNVSFKDGWFRTGDIGRIDEDSSLHITGRLKNTINRGGLKIQAEEIESVVLQHADIAEALAIGVPDDRLGERVGLCVVPKAGCRFDGTTLLAHLDRHGVTKFKWPELIAVRTALPRNAIGKQDRIALRAQVADILFAKVGS